MSIPWRNYLDIVFYISTHLKLVMQNQNPENYAIKRGIPIDRIEKHMNGTFMNAYKKFPKKFNLFDIFF